MGKNKEHRSIRLIHMAVNADNRQRFVRFLYCEEPLFLCDQHFLISNRPIKCEEQRPNMIWKYKNSGVISKRTTQAAKNARFSRNSDISIVGGEIR